MCILSILNSTLAAFFIKKIAFDFTEGAFTKVRTNQLGQLPIPIFGDNENILTGKVDQVMGLKENGINTHEFEDHIDQLVYQFYCLTEEEIAIIENSTKT